MPKNEIDFGLATSVLKMPVPSATPPKSGLQMCGHTVFNTVTNPRDSWEQQFVMDWKTLLLGVAGLCSFHTAGWIDVMVSSFLQEGLKTQPEDLALSGSYSSNISFFDSLEDVGDRIVGSLGMVPIDMGALW